MGHGRVRPRPPRRRLLDGVEHHAAEAQPGRRRAGPRQERPRHRQPRAGADAAQGPAAGVQPRPAGGQGAAVRLRRHAARYARGRRRHAPHAALRRRARPRGGSRRLRARDGPRRPPRATRRAVPRGARGRRRLVAELRAHGPDVRGADARRLPRRPPAFGEDILSLDIEASLAARSATGGTAPARVAEQREAARARLREEAE